MMELHTAHKYIMHYAGGRLTVLCRVRSFDWHSLLSLIPIFSIQYVRIPIERAAHISLRRTLANV